MDKPNCKLDYTSGNQKWAWRVLGVHARSKNIGQQNAWAWVLKAQHSASWSEGGLTLPKCVWIRNSGLKPKEQMNLSPLHRFVLSNQDKPHKLSERLSLTVSCTTASQTSPSIWVQSSPANANHQLLADAIPIFNWFITAAIPTFNPLITDTIPTTVFRCVFWWTSSWRRDRQVVVEEVRKRRTLTNKARIRRIRKELWRDGFPDSTSTAASQVMHHSSSLFDSLFYLHYSFFFFCSLLLQSS